MKTNNNLLMPNENGAETIIIETNKNVEKPECGNIGEKNGKKWYDKIYIIKKDNECLEYLKNGGSYKRNCPKCGIEIFYHSKKAWQLIKTAERKKSLCNSCRSKRYLTNFLEKHCPHCKSIIKFKHRSSLNSSIKRNSLCNKCCVKIWQNKKWGNGLQPIVTFTSKCIKCGKEKNHKWTNKSLYQVETLKKKANSRMCRHCAFVYRLNKIVINKEYTKPELKIQNILKNLEIDYKPHYTICNRVYDIYIENKNILIEVDGNYWHGKGLRDDQLNETQKRSRINDKLKNKIAIDNNIKLIRIWEDEITEENVKKLLNYE